MIVGIIFVRYFVDTDALSSINIVCSVIDNIVGLGTMFVAGEKLLPQRKWEARLG